MQELTVPSREPARDATTIVFPLPKSCEAAWEEQRHLRPQTKGYRGGGAWHGGGIACGQGEHDGHTVYRSGGAPAPLARRQCLRHAHPTSLSWMFAKNVGKGKTIDEHDGHV